MDLQTLVEGQTQTSTLDDLLAHLHVAVEQLQTAVGAVQPQREVELGWLFALHVKGDLCAELGIRELRTGHLDLVVFQLPRTTLVLVLISLVLIGNLDAFEVGCDFSGHHLGAKGAVEVESSGDVGRRGDLNRDDCPSDDLRLFLAHRVNYNILASGI